MTTTFEINPNIEAELARVVTPAFIRLVNKGGDYAREEVPIDKGDLFSTISAEVENPGTVRIRGILSAGGAELIALRGRDYSWFVEFNNKSYLRVALFRLSLRLQGSP